MPPTGGGRLEGPTVEHDGGRIRRPPIGQAQQHAQVVHHGLEAPRPELALRLLTDQ